MMSDEQLLRYARGVLNNGATPSAAVSERVLSIAERLWAEREAQRETDQS